MVKRRGDGEEEERVGRQYEAIAIPLKQTSSFQGTFISLCLSSPGVRTKMPDASEDCLIWYQYSDRNYGTNND